LQSKRAINISVKSAKSASKKTKKEAGPKTCLLTFSLNKLFKTKAYFFFLSSSPPMQSRAIVAGSGIMTL
jgi:hypothetical protein